jgi:hypothetical protein
MKPEEVDAMTRVLLTAGTYLIFGDNAGRIAANVLIGCPKPKPSEIPSKVIEWIR